MMFTGIKQVSRSLWRYKSFTLINIFGLAIGIAALTLLLLLADFENSFDEFHQSTNSIYRVVVKTNDQGSKAVEASVPYSLGALLRTEIPGIPATEIHFAEEVTVRAGHDQPFTERNVVFADSLFFKVFDFAKIPGFWIRGSKEKFITEPDKAILTKSSAAKYFHGEDPIGKTIKLNNQKDVEVVAIVKDLPATTHLPASFFVTFSSLSKDFLGGLDPQQWGVRSNGYCYVNCTGSASTITSALSRLIKREAEGDDDKKEVMYLQALKSIHFDAAFESTNPSYTVTSKYVGLLVLLGTFILLIACVNYINLSTSLALSKAKDVGIRKTIGASRAQLFFHYLFETFILTLAATGLGVGITAAALPLFNELLQKSVSLSQLLSLSHLLLLIGGIVMISFLSGFYPALVLSGFRPIESLKSSSITPGRSSTILRKSLVTFQFVISIGLIICTIIFAQQTRFFQSKSLGFNKDAVVEVGLPSNDSAKMEQFKSAIQNQTGISNFSLCLGAPISTNGLGTHFQTTEHPNLSQPIKLLPADYNYLSTYDIHLAAGRWFLPGESKYRDSATAIVVNESLVRSLGFANAADAIGKKIVIGVNDLDLPIIGVTKDFHTSSLHEQIPPIGLMPFSFFYYAAAIKIEPSSVARTLSAVEAAWKSTYPDDVYSFKFVDETLAKLYERETKDYSLFKAFSAIAIFICCIGLWGLIAFTITRKTKEIGIRKVLGASVGGIVGLLSKDFLRLAFIALCVATPVSWYFMNKWLENFAYRIHIGWWVFPLAGIAAVLIAFITISFQAIKAAIANPVKSLRNE